MTPDTARVEALLTGRPAVDDRRTSQAAYRAVMDIRPPTNIEDERAERWLHQRYRGYRTVLIGTAVLCVGCGRMLGVATVAFPPDYEPPPDPDWPFGQEWCPVCGGTEPERIKHEDIQRRLEEQRQRKMHDPKRLP